MAVAVEAPAGRLSPSHASIALSRRGAQATAFGVNPDDPDGNTTLLRVWEMAGVSADLPVTLPEGAEFTTTPPVNLRGEPIGNPVRIKDGGFTYPLGNYAPASFLIESVVK